MEDHDKHLVKVLQRLKDSGIMLNPDKCLFSMSRLQYLGQVIDSYGIRKDAAKVKAITEVPEPKEFRDVRRFLIMVNQQKKFLPNLAKMTKTIQDLLKKDTQWIWDSPQKEAFNLLKNELASNEALEKKTIVSTDASGYGLGAVIRQHQNDRTFKAVAYASRSMTKN